MIWAAASLKTDHRLAILRRIRYAHGMEIIFLIIGGLVSLSVIIVLIEHKRGRAFRIQDVTADNRNSHTAQELTRIDAEITDRAMGHRDPH